MKTATQVNTRSLITVLKQVRLWWEDVQMIKIAKQRNWASALDWMNTESRYRSIKRHASTGKDRGIYDC